MKTTAHKVRAAAMAAIAGGALSAYAQPAQVIAYWNFETVEADGTTVKAAVGNYSGQLNDLAALTPDGRPGGGKALDVSQSTSSYLFVDGTDIPENHPFNAAAVEDRVTVVLWQKNNSNRNSSSIWAVAEGQDRAWQFHIPWSDGTIYFDTSGGCCSAAQRLNRNVVGALPDFDWTAWHHYTFIKDGEYKAVYIDGVLFHEGVGFAPIAAEGYSRLTIGGQDRSASPDALLDDVAIYKGVLTQAEIDALVAGATPGGPRKDTDNDGMPDDWETLYGFNPNDPSDAAKDFDLDGVSNLDEFKAGTVPNDVTAPTVVGAMGTDTLNTVIVTFSEAVDATTATTLANYSISPALNVTAASVKGKVVTLTTADQTPGATMYTVTINNVTDGSKNKVPVNSQAVFYSYLKVKEGALKFSYWGGINGTPIQNLLDDPRWPATPDMVGGVFSFNSRDIFPNDSHDNYGATIEGFLTPKETADYRFFLYSDDAGQLYLSSDATEGNLALIAEETGCCNFFTEPGDHTRTSEPINLKAGTRYFIRGIYKEGGGGDYMQVAWRKEGDPTPAGSLTPMPGHLFSSAVDVAAPPQGAFLSQVPGTNAKNVSPATKVTISHRDGAVAWTSANVSLKFDGQAVTPTYTKVGNVLTIDFDPPGLLASASTHQVELTYPDPGGNPTTLAYSFQAFAYGGPTRDKVGNYPGLLAGSSVYTADAGGHTAKPGDYAVDLTMRGGPVVTFDAAFLAAANAATSQDEFSVAFWQKKHDVADSSAFTLHSPSAGNNRGFHAHVPWSNQNIYFDTVGCCDGATQRISAGIDTFPDYTGDATYFTGAWHLYAFTKKGATKNIWIDGKLFLTGESTNPLKNDHIAFYMGSGAGGAELSHGLIDDFSVYGKELTEADVVALTAGTLPTALPAARGLIAYWDFNDKSVAPPTPPTLSISPAAGGKVTITFEGTLQASDSAAGPYSALSGSSPLTIDAAGAAKFIRAVK